MPMITSKNTPMITSKNTPMITSKNTPMITSKNIKNEPKKENTTAKTTLRSVL